MLSKGWGQVEARDEKMKQNWIKSPKKSRTARSRGTARPCQAARPAVPPRTAVRPPRTAVRVEHGWPCVPARLAVRGCAILGTSLPGVHGRAPLWHPRARPVFCCFAVLWYSGRPRTSNLPWSYIWSPLSHRNLLISPEMKTNTI